MNGTEAQGDAPADRGSVVALLGDARAAVLERIRREGERTAPELATDLGCSDVAVRRHLAALEEDGFLAARTVKQGRGRPAAHYRLTDRGRNLFPQRYAGLASELIDFITDEHGRQGLRRYLRWRLERQTDDLAEQVTGDSLDDRLEQLASALSDAGYDATVSDDGDGFRLTQHHCAIYSVAKHHPEMCAYEAATFRRLLGKEVTLSRRETLAAGSNACVCSVTTSDRTTDD